jgi:hypothetical protein
MTETFHGAFVRQVECEQKTGLCKQVGKYHINVTSSGVRRSGELTDVEFIV